MARGSRPMRMSLPEGEEGVKKNELTPFSPSTPFSP